MPSAPSQIADADPGTWSVYQRMIGLRRRHPWLTRAATSTAQVANEHLLVHAVAGDDRLTLALNLSDGPFPLPQGLGAVLEAGEPVHDGAVAPHSWAVLEG